MTAVADHPQPTSFRSRIPRRWLGAFVALLVVPAILMGTLTFLSNTYFADPLNARSVTAAELADEYGVKVDLVAVTAAGGAVDVRFTILDPDKAGHVLHGDESMPALIVDSDNAVIRVRSVHRHNDLTTLERSTYSILYPNPGGLVQRGTEVSVVVEGLRLSHLTAQS
jgi:hypothetical protein